MKKKLLSVGPGNPTSEASRKKVSVAVIVAPAGGKIAAVVAPAKVEACWAEVDPGRA